MFIRRGGIVRMASHCCGGFSGPLAAKRMLDAKTRKLKTLRKESDKVRINLLSFFLSGARSDSLGHVRKSVSISEAGAWRSPVSRAQDGSERGGAFPIRSEATQRLNPERTIEVQRKLYARLKPGE